jgi:putative membrane protein
VYPPTTLVAPPFSLAPTSPCVLQSNVIYGLGMPAGIPTAADLGGVKAQSAAAAGALGLVSSGLTGSAIPGINKMKAGIGTPSAAGTLLNGLAQMSAGVGQLKTGIYHACSPSDPTFPDTCGISQVERLLQLGVIALVDSIGSTLSGNPDLAKLVAGSAQVADGNAQLATGLEPAAAGATQISDGLNQAVPGGTQIEDGANQLSAQGSKLLIAKGNETTNSYGEQYATMEALNARSATQAGIPNGPAKGQDVVTTGAFGYTLQGVSQADSTNALRFLLAGLLLAGAVGVGVAFSRT